MQQRTIGVKRDKSGMASVSLWAPDAEEVAINMTSKNLKLPLEKSDFGYWKLHTNEIEVGDAYKFVLNNEKELPDPASRYQPEGVHGHSEVVDLEGFSWSDSAWKNISLEEYIIYELHVGTFTSEGTFAGVAGKLDYLKGLGINAIEIMPVAQFPGKRNWGYDGAYPFAVQYSYGGPKGLQQLVDTCHAQGFAVVLDVVYNHLGPEGNYLPEFGPYFTDKYSTPWGKAINFDDAWSDNVRHYFIENCLMWFRDFHVDALRLDAVHAIKDFSPKHILMEMKENVDRLMKETGREYYLIAESDLNDVRYINPIEKFGYGMDAQWADDFHHALRVTSGNTKTGYYIEYNGIKDLAKSYRNAYVFDGIYSKERKKTFGSKTDHNPGKQFVVFSQNHDQVGNRPHGERTTHLIDYEMRKVLAGAVLASPFLPMLFMGEEFSATSPFLYFVSHTDAELVEAVRQGRKLEFAHAHEGIEPVDPQAISTLEASKLSWRDLDEAEHSHMLQYYQTLIAIRKENAALHNLNRNQLEVRENEAQQTLVLHRWHDKQHIICLMNFSEEPQQVEVKVGAVGSWKKILASSDPRWLGPEAAPDSIGENATVMLLPKSFSMYKLASDVQS